MQNCVSNSFFLWKVSICLASRVATAIIMASMTVGQASAFAPNYNKAIIGSARIFKLLDRVPLIDASGQTGADIVSTSSHNLLQNKTI